MSLDAPVLGISSLATAAAAMKSNNMRMTDSMTADRKGERTAAPAVLKGGILIKTQTLKIANGN